MLSQSTNAIVPDQAVTYKFKVPEFAELFESLSPEQIHIALEGALNVVFAQAAAKNLLAVAAGDLEEEEEQNEEEDQLDHEAQIISSVTFALFAHHQGQEAEAGAELVPVEDPENTPEYAQLEETFRTIIDHFALAITADEYNQDVTTLYGEMQFFNHIELFTYSYDTKNEVLSVTLTATTTE